MTHQSLDSTSANFVTGKRQINAIFDGHAYALVIKYGKGNTSRSHFHTLSLVKIPFPTWYSLAVFPATVIYKIHIKWTLFCWQIPHQNANTVKNKPNHKRPHVRGLFLSGLVLRHSDRSITQCILNWFDEIWKTVLHCLSFLNNIKMWVTEVRPGGRQIVVCHLLSISLLLIRWCQ